MEGSLNELYRALKISRQSVHQRINREQKMHLYEHQLLFLVYEVRQEHPTMGARDMYYLLEPSFIGRDRFESFCKLHGLVSERPVNYKRTTNSSGVIKFENLTIKLKLNSINQLWVSDITYYQVKDVFYYLTFIMDGYSRVILGYQVSKKLFTEQTTLPALQKAIKFRKGKGLKGTILHSDGGGQYYDKAFLEKTKQLGIINSMCEYPWENGKAERINGVIKNNYLRHRTINNFSELVKEVDRAIKLYNEKKPHIALNRVSPLNFENRILQKGKHPTVRSQRRNISISNRRDKSALRAEGKTSSSSNITQEYN